MLQNLLSERFGLAFHHEKGELKAYALIRSPRSIKIKPSVTQDGKLSLRNYRSGMNTKKYDVRKLAPVYVGPIGAPGRG